MTDPRLLENLRRRARMSLPDTAPLSLCPEGAALERIERLDAENERLCAVRDNLRFGLEEIIRCTEPRAGSGDVWIMKVAIESLKAAGFSTDGAGIPKPQPFNDPDKLKPGSM